MRRRSRRSFCERRGLLSTAAQRSCCRHPCGIALGDVESGVLRLQLLWRVAQDRGRVLRVQEPQLSKPDQPAPPLLRFSLLSAHTEAELPCSAWWRDSAGYETSELASVTAMNRLCSAMLPQVP